jgi:hypothetical protein
MSTLELQKLPSDIPEVSKILGIDQSSASWLIAATDPFHDVSFEMHGYPDLCASNSLIRAEKTTAQISAPAAVTWDCHVSVVNDLMTGVYAGSSFNSTTQAITIGATTATYGHCNITRVLSGQDTYPSASTWAPTNFVSSCLPSTNDSLTDAAVRLIGCGVEIVNTSAPIYAQGSVIVYRQANNTGSLVYESSTGTPTRKTTLPPITSEQALRIPNAKQWEARKGAYAVQLMNSEHNPFGNPEVLSNLRAWNFGFSGGAGGALWSGIGSQHLYVPFDNVGAYFTNLAPETVLKVTFVRYLEVVPLVNSANIALTSPSATYDEKALQIYGRMISILPPATHVSDNASGDWFRGIMRLAKEAIPRVAKAIDFVTGTSHASNIVSGVSAVRKLAKKTFSSPTPKNQKKKSKQ